MTNNTIQLVLDIINKELFKKDIKLNTNNIDEKLLFKVIKSHHLETITYNSLKKYNLSINDELYNLYNRSLYRNLMQNHYFDIIKDEFNKENIKFIPLKGFIIKNIYPKEYFRTMSDIDILVKEKDTKKIKSIMEKLNFDVKNYNRAHHDSYLNNENVLIEIHRTLLTTDNKYMKYFKNKNYFKDSMNKEEFYIYMIIHMTKHFINGGLGIRNFIDIKIYLDKYKNKLDFNYINKCFEDLKLTKFHNEMINIKDLWFEDYKRDEKIERIEEYILRSGTYGLIKNRAAIKIIKNKNKRYYFRRIFPSLNEMKGIYHKLNKYPFLLPYYWVVRIFRAIFKSDIKEEVTEINKITDKDLYNIEKVLKDVDLI